MLKEKQKKECKKISKSHHNCSNTVQLEMTGKNRKYSNHNKGCVEKEIKTNHCYFISL